MLARALTADLPQWLLEKLIRKWDPFSPDMFLQFKISVFRIQRSMKLTLSLQRSQPTPPSLLLFIQEDMRSRWREKERTRFEYWELQES